MPPFPLPRVLIIIECPFPRLFLRRFRHYFAARSRSRVFLVRHRLRRGFLAFLDQGAHAVSALLPDLLVEGGPPLRLDRLAALLADLLVEAGAALRLDGVAALLADLLVEGAAALRLDGLAALAADFLVEGMAVLVAHGL